VVITFVRSNEYEYEYIEFEQHSCK
jgi:hypothetical protein